MEIHVKKPTYPLRNVPKISTYGPKVCNFWSHTTNLQTSGKSSDIRLRNSESAELA